MSDRDTIASGVHPSNVCMPIKAAKRRNTALETTRMLTRYKAWANRITYSMVLGLLEGEGSRPRPMPFCEAVRSLNDVYVADGVFRARLEGRRRGRGERFSRSMPPLDELWAAVQAMDAWYMDYSEGLTNGGLREMIGFEFGGGGHVAMTREEVLLHVVHLGIHVRGSVGEILRQVPTASPADDLPGYLFQLHQT